MQELINQETYKVGDYVYLNKFDSANAKIIKVNKTTLTVILSSLDLGLDERIFNVKPTDIYRHTKNNRKVITNVV